MAQKQLKNLKPSIRKCLTTRFEPATMKTGCTNLVWWFAAHCQDDHQGGDTDSEFGTISSEESHLRLCSYPKIHDFDEYGIKKDKYCHNAINTHRLHHEIISVDQ